MNISMREIKKYQKNSEYVIVDLRTRSEYEKGHIENAINIPYDYLNIGMRKLSRGNKYIFYCSHGNLSIMATRLFLKNGYKAINTVGGFDSYKRM